MRRVLFYFLLCLIATSLILKSFESNIFNLRFADEEINFITGKWVLGGVKLYDYFFNHQPIPSLFSAGIQFITNPNTIFLLVKRHREFIFFFSIAAWWWLSVRFGLRAWVAGLVILLTKHVLLGWLFLSESLVVPFVLYVIFILLDLTINKDIKKIDYWLFPFSLLFIQFNLLPLTLFVIFSIIYFRCLLRGKGIIKKMVVPWLVTLFLFFLLLLPGISIQGYFNYTILANLKEMIPSEATYTFFEAAKLILFKVFEVWTMPNDIFYIFLKAISGLLIVSWILGGIFKNWKLILAEIFISFLLSVRPLPLGTGYSGFHFLPWFGGCMVFLFYNLDFLRKKRLAIKLALSSSLLIIVISVYIGYIEYSPHSDQFERWYVNYSPSYDYGEIVRLLSSRGDTLFASPDASLIYWHSGLRPNANYFFVFSFMHQSKKIDGWIESSWEQNPPVFAYIEDSEMYSGLLDEKYGCLTKYGKKSNLYVRKDKLALINYKQWQAVLRLGVDGVIK